LVSAENRRLYRALRALLATAFLLLTLATYNLWRQYGSTRPSLMDEGSGQVHPLYALGWTVYLTRSDQFRLYGLGVAAAFCLVGAVALDTFVLGKKECD
jgi:hypothetical protein